MLRRLNEIRGFRIAAIDDTIGDAHDFFFDDRTWTVRYLVVDTGKWLPGRRVLISPEALGEPNQGRRELPVALTKAQVKDSPGIGADLPVSRQEEMRLREHFGWPEYWGLYPSELAAAPVAPAIAATVAPESLSDERNYGDPNLRSAKEVESYHIAARDGEIGHVHDFMLDDQTWAIRYLVIDTRNWLPGRKVIIAPRWAEDVDWAKQQVHVNLNREEIKNSPEYDPAAPIIRDYEANLHEHYRRPAYWS